MVPASYTVERAKQADVRCTEDKPHVDTEDVCTGVAVPWTVLFGSSGV